MRKAAELLRQKLQTDPSNARGWMLYARTSSILGEWNNAADAYRHAIDLGLKDAATYAGYGEMLVMGAGGGPEQRGGALLSRSGGRAIGRGTPRDRRVAGTRRRSAGRLADA